MIKSRYQILNKVDFSEELIRKPSVLVLVFSVCFSFWMADLWKPYNQDKGGHNFYWDVFGYYSYLPAYFCNDGKFEFKNELADHNPPGPLGTHVPKYTYGMSVMYAPFFALGYKIAFNQHSPLDGFSQPFVVCIRWGSIFYVLLGLFFLRKFLLVFFNEYVTAITLGAVLFGSLVFFYTFVQSELTHGYLFSLFCIFLYLIHRWHLHPGYLNTLWVGLVLGLITLIRPTELFVVILFVFWQVRSWSDIRSKFFFFLSHYKKILLIMLIGACWWIPQLFIYKQHAGVYFYFSYMRERFFWNDPQIINVLFSYRKGWITYTPLVAIAFTGIIFIKKSFPLSKLTLIVAHAVILYVLSCWWDWQYGGCFGARSFCPQLAILAIPLASLIHYVFYDIKKQLVRNIAGLLLLTLLCSCVCLNIGQSYQYNTNHKIHPWGMTKKIYWKVLRQYQFTDEYQYQWWADLDEPDFIKYSDGTDRDQ